MSDLTDQIRHDVAVLDLVREHLAGRHEQAHGDCLACDHARISAELAEAKRDRDLAIGCDMRSDADLFADLDEAAIAKIKADLDDLHKRKIDLADEVLVLNVGGYIGDSTRSEIAYAQQLGKPIRWLEATVDAAEARDMTGAFPVAGTEADRG